MGRIGCGVRSNTKIRIMTTTVTTLIVAIRWECALHAPYATVILRATFSSLGFYDLQTQVTLRSSQRRARPAIANQDFTYSTFWNPVSMVTLVPVI